MPKLTKPTELSGSSVAAAMGVDPWKNANDLIDLAAISIDGLPLPEITGEQLSWGNVLESTILKEACLRLGITNLNLDHKEAYRHKTIPLAVSLDGSATLDEPMTINHNPDEGIFVENGEQITINGFGCLEAKNTSVTPEETLPLHRGVVQLQAQMLCAGAKWGAVCVLYRGNQLRIFLYSLHDKICYNISKIANEFDMKVKHYQTHKEKLYYEPSSSLDAARLFDKTIPVSLDLDDSINETCEYILNVKAEISDLNKIIREKEKTLGDYYLNLQKRMGHHETASNGRYYLKWSTRHYKAQPERFKRSTTVTVKELI
jgi:predicted phage-related endonuclease